MNQEMLRGVTASYNYHIYGEGAELPNPYEGGAYPTRNSTVIRQSFTLWLEKWSASGAYERKAAFDPMIARLQKYIPITEKNAYTKRVLIPGCGLGRLPAEVAAKGFAVEGNEFSAFMLMAEQPY